MQTVQMLFCHQGEISYTPKDPVDIWPSEKYAAVDLSEKKTCIISHDFWEPVLEDKWEIRAMELPDYVDPERYATNTRYRIEIKYLRGRMSYAGLADDHPFTPAQAERLFRLSNRQQYAALQLLKVKNFKSAFRASLREQLEKWLSGQTDYQSPFSRRQWETITGHIPTWQIENMDESIYRSH